MFNNSRCINKQYKQNKRQTKSKTLKQTENLTQWGRLSKTPANLVSDAFLRICMFGESEFSYYVYEFENLKHSGVGCPHLVLILN